VVQAPGTLVIDTAGDILAFNTPYGNTTMAIVQSEYFMIYQDSGASQGVPIFTFSNGVYTDPFSNTIGGGLFLGQVGTPTTSPTAGIQLYVDASGNLKALTQDGNTRTIAAV
jgi:hypothetical protein